MVYSPPGSSVHGILQARILPNSGTEPTSLMSAALAGRFFTASATWEAYLSGIRIKYNGECKGIFGTDTIGYEWKSSATSRSNSSGVLLI